MRHNKKNNHLGRKSAHRKAMLSNMACALIIHKRIFTTLPKARELRKYVEPIITKCKNDTTHSRRLVFQQLQNKYVVSELFQDVALQIGDRPGGYTRIIKTGNRLGDNADMCFIELVDYNELMLSRNPDAKKTKSHRTRRSSRKIPVQGNQSPKQGTYADAEMRQLVGFRSIYPDQEPPTITSLLLNIPREKVIRVAQVLDRLYKNAEISDMQKFFSPSNQKLKEEFNSRFQKICNPNQQYNFCSIQTYTELLKQSFAIPYKESEDKEDENVEENLLKAILLINDKIMDFKYDNSKTLDPLQKTAELFLVNSFSQKDINNFDYNDVFREVLTKSIDLYEYVSSDKYFIPIYQRFLEKLQIRDYKDYIRTILGLFGIIHKNATQSKQNNQIEQWAGTFHYDPSNDPDKIININVLDYISMGLNKNISLNENEDYKVFRNEPLIKMADGSYEIVNVGFLLERLFSSLYFDFKTIADELGLKNFSDEYKQSFMEKTLLCKYLENINSSQKYKAVSSADSLTMRQKGEGGEPDYYMRSNNNTVVLFENKDIMISGQIKESRDFDKIIAEYKNKLLLKTYNDKGLISSPKPEGIGQLIEQAKKIQKENAFWDKDAPKDSIVYPVLVLGDSKLLPDGLPFLMQKWHEERCLSEGVDVNKIKPLIVLSVSTLLLYTQEFKDKGFEFYFEEYYKSIEDAKNIPSENILLNAINACISFSEYMKKAYPKDFADIFNSYKTKLFPSN